MGGLLSSNSKIEQFLINNPVDAEWVRQAMQIKSDFYTHPYLHFDVGDLKELIKKTEEAMRNYHDNCGFSYNSLIEIKDAFDNSRIVQMREL